MGGGGVGVGGQSTTITQQPHQQQSLHFELQGQVQQTPAMEEFLEHIFAMPWDYNAGAGAMAMERAGADFAMVGVGANNNGDNNNIDSGGSSMSTAAQKRFTMSLTPPGLLNNGTLVGGNQASALVSSQALVNQVLEEKKESGVESVHCSADDALITTHLHQQQQQLQGEETLKAPEFCAFVCCFSEDRCRLSDKTPENWLLRGGGRAGLLQMSKIFSKAGHASFILAVRKILELR
jgi:hypothetical protein